MRSLKLPAAVLGLFAASGCEQEACADVTVEYAGSKKGIVSKAQYIDGFLVGGSCSPDPLKATMTSPICWFPPSFGATAELVVWIATSHEGNQEWRGECLKILEDGPGPSDPVARQSFVVTKEPPKVHLKLRDP